MEDVQSPLIAAVLGFLSLLVGKAFKAIREWLRERAGDKYDAAVTAFEQGVQEAWETEGKGLKRANPESKYTDTQKKTLLGIAKDFAVKVGNKRGLDVVKLVDTFGPGVSLLVKKIVDRRKRGKS